MPQLYFQQGVLRSASWCLQQQALCPGVWFMPIFMSKSLFHLSVVWRVLGVPVTALGSRCHLEGLVTTTLAWQELGSPCPEEALQPPLRVLPASEQPWHCGVRGGSSRGPRGRTEQEIWLKRRFNLLFVGDSDRKWAGTLSRPQGVSSGLARCGLGRRPQRTERVFPVL